MAFTSVPLRGADRTFAAEVWETGHEITSCRAACARASAFRQLLEDALAQQAQAAIPAEAYPRHVPDWRPQA